MANVIGELTVILDGNVKGFVAAMDSAQKTAEAAVAKIQQSVTAASQRIKDGLNDTAASFGKLSESIGPRMLQVSGALAGVSTIAMGATQGLEHLRRELEKMPKGGATDEIKKSLDSLLEVLQPVTMGLMGVTGAVSAMSIALPLLSTPIGLVVAGLAALTAGAYAMYNSFQKSMEAVKGADPNFKSLGNSINLTTDELKKLNDELDKAEQKAALKEIGSAIKVHVVTDAEKQKAAEEARKKRVEQEEADIKRLRDFEVERWKANEQAVDAYGKALERATAKGIDQQDQLMETLDRAAAAQRKRTAQIQQEVIWTGKQADRIEEVNSEILNGVSASQKAKQAQEDLRKVWGENQRDAKDAAAAQRRAMQEVSTIMNDLVRGLARAIIHWKGFKEAGLSALEAVGEAITRQLIQKLLESTKIVDKLVEWLGKLFGLGGKQSTGIPGVPGTGGSIPGIPGKGGGGGAAGTAMSGAMGWIGVGASVVSAVSDVIGNFQMARQENTLNAIEWNTRKSSIHLEDLLNKANENWPYLGQITDRLWAIQGQGMGMGGGANITIQYTGDVRSFAMMLLSELQRMGLRVAPA